MEPIRFEAEVLYVEDMPAATLAAEYGTPLYVYSRRAIAESWQRFDAAFDGFSHRVCYAVKANSNLGVLSLLAELGASFDIVSIGEMERVLRAGGRADRIVFSGVGKQSHEIEAALAAGIACINVESGSELTRIGEIAARTGFRAPVSLRVNPDVDARTHPYISTGLRENKFGVPVDEAMTLYRRAADMPMVDIVGIDCHIGSQINALAPFTDALARILALVDELAATGIELAHIDLGGGIGVQYKDETPLDIEEYAGAIRQAMGHRRAALWFEPGRYLVANAGLLLTRVVTLKDNEEKHFAVVDAAMNDLIRPALYDAWQRVTRVEPGPGRSETWDIVGPVCETGDFLAKDRHLSLAEGDLLAIHSAGAYGFVMSSNYNSRSRAAEVIVAGDQSQCVRTRETIDDQLRLERKFTL